MLAVFKVLNSAGFRVVQSASPEVTWFLVENMTGQRHGTTWVPPEVQIVADDENGIPLTPFDAAIQGCSGHGFILTRHAVERIGGFLKDYGEILPLSCAQEELYAFNSTIVLPALDHGNAQVSKFSDGRIFGIRKYAFHSERISHEIFRISDIRRSNVYFTDKAADVWRSSGLRGIEFAEIWRK